MAVRSRDQDSDKNSAGAEWKGRDRDWVEANGDRQKRGVGSLEGTAIRHELALPSR